MQKRILLIGSLGNVGSQLVKHLKAQGHQVFESDILPGFRPNYFQADINQGLDLLPAFDAAKPDIVYLLAAMVSRVTCEATPSLCIQTNLVGPQNVIELCKRYKSKLVYFSTSEIYGNDTPEMTEELDVPKPNNRYGLSKWLGEYLVKYECQYNELRAHVVRPFMFYHEDETRGDHRSAMVRFATNLCLGKPIEVHAGSGRPWMHMDDAVVSLERAGLLEEHNGEVINIGHPDYVLTEELAEWIRSYFNASKSLVNITKLPNKMTLVKKPYLVRQLEWLKVQPKVDAKSGTLRVCKRIQQELAGELAAKNLGMNRVR